MKLLSQRLCIYSHFIGSQMVLQSGLDKFPLSPAERKNSRGPQSLGAIRTIPNTWDVFTIFLISIKVAFFFFKLCKNSLAGHLDLTGFFVKSF